MKKSLLLVFCAAILLCATSAKAQTLSQSSGNTVTLDANGMVRPMASGESTVLITVLDIHSSPIQGALVSAPCISTTSKYTDAHGVASWSTSGACPCTKAQIHVTTAGCDKYVDLPTCGTLTVTCP
ncbi:MAG: hypothetical protein JWO03_2636 [Bacteroidetes bacterium]|nr:hypothetical protein [Bacteroidota bacterium]